MKRWIVVLSVLCLLGAPPANGKILENAGFVMKDGKVFKRDLGPER